MEYREIGTTGIKISAVGLGGMRLPGVGDDQAVAAIRRALEKGVNFYETGYFYGMGRSEQLIGQGVEGKTGPSNTGQQDRRF